MTRTTAITLQALPAQRDLIDRAAHALGMSRSDFMLEAASDRAHNVLLDRTRFELDQTRFARFTELLDAPPQPDAALERLMATKAPWNEQRWKAGQEFVFIPKGKGVLMIPAPRSEELAGMAKGADPAGYRDRLDRY